jgi:hypothetical protein
MGKRALKQVSMCDVAVFPPVVPLEVEEVVVG